jgi:hypothetical protein
MRISLFGWPGLWASSQGCETLVRLRRLEVRLDCRLDDDDEKSLCGQLTWAVGFFSGVRDVGSARLEVRLRPEVELGCRLDDDENKPV